MSSVIKRFFVFVLGGVVLGQMCLKEGTAYNTTLDIPQPSVPGTPLLIDSVKTCPRYQTPCIDMLILSLCANEAHVLIEAMHALAKIFL